MPKISDLGSRGIVLYSENKGADQLRSCCAADLRLCFRICKKLHICKISDSHDAAEIAHVLFKNILHILRILYLRKVYVKFKNIDEELLYILCESEFNHAFIVTSKK